MEPKVIENLSKRIKTAHEEMKVLYELGEAEAALLTLFLQELPSSDLARVSPKLAAKLLRAAAHFLETIEELSDDFLKELKK
jgi:hypothetical protein